MRKIFMVLFILVFAFGTQTFADDITIELNGSVVESEVKPVIIDGNTFIPVRPVAEAMRCKVYWYDDVKEANIQNKDTVVALGIGSNVMQVAHEGGEIESVTLAYEPRIINGSSYLPMRPMLEALGAQVEWDGATKTIDITYIPDAAEFEKDSAGTVLTEDINDTVTAEFNTGTGTMTLKGSGIAGDDIMGTIYLHEWEKEDVKSVVIKDGITAIGDRAFYGYKALKTVSIAPTVKTIGKNAFYKCENLTEVSIPSSVTDIGEYAFFECIKLGSAQINGNIGNYAFYGCETLTSVTMGNNINQIGERAFLNCGKLKEIILPSSLKSIGTDAFGSCWELESIVMPDSVTTIGEDLFLYCSKLKEAKLSANLTAIPDDTFDGCDKLQNVTIPDSVKEIGAGAFYFCRELKSIVIPDSVTRIGKEAFYACIDVEEITIPDSVTYMGENAFTSSSKLKTLNCSRETIDRFPILQEIEQSIKNKKH